MSLLRDKLATCLAPQDGDGLGGGPSALEEAEGAVATSRHDPTMER